MRIMVEKQEKLRRLTAAYGWRLVPLNLKPPMTPAKEVPDIWAIRRRPAQLDVAARHGAAQIPGGAAAVYAIREKQ